MEPLRKVFPRLKETTLVIVTDYVKHGNNPMSCAICDGDTFSELHCEQCPFKDQTLRDLLIESYVPMVMDIARKLGREKRTECISVGLLALTEAVNRIPIDIENLGLYLRVCVVSQVKLHLIKDSVIRVPVYGSLTHGHLRHVCQVKNIDQLVAVVGDQTTVDLNEILNAIPRNKTEKIIMNCITEGGYSLQDMAEMCRLERSRVSQIKHSLLSRIDTTLKKEPV